MFKVQRPGQVRGVTWFAPVLKTSRDLDDFIDALNVKARVEACFSGFITNDDQTSPLIDPNTTGIDQTQDESLPNVPLTSLEPGLLKELRSGQSITFAQPTTNTQMEPMMLYNMMMICAGVGCTYDQGSGDLRQANYSSLRAGKLDFWKLVSEWQDHTVIPMLCKPVWDRFISRAILSGALKPMKGGYPCNWITPAREAVDPKKDLDAEKNEVRSGRMTPQEFIASKGGDWRVQLDDFAEFFKEADKKKILFDIDVRQVDQHGRQPTRPTTSPQDDEAAAQIARDAADQASDDAESGDDDRPDDRE
jgi:lambda family phage portal protein